MQDIMKQNIQDVLGRGERLESVAAKSSSLREASGKCGGSPRAATRTKRAITVRIHVASILTRADVAPVACVCGRYAKDARALNLRAMLRKYGPIAVVLLLVTVMLYWRFFR